MLQGHKDLILKFDRRTQAVINSMLIMLQQEGQKLRILDAGCGNGEKFDTLPPWSEFLGKIFPNLGKTLIAKVGKVE